MMEQEETPGPEKVVYRENVYFSLGLCVLIVGLIALYIAIMIGAIVKHNRVMTIIFCAMTVVLLAIFVNFWRLVFIITETQVIFGFGLIKKRFERSDIKTCEPYTLEFGNYYGYGIRIGRDGTIAYNTRNGPGVKLVVEGCKRPYVVCLKNAGYVCKLLGPDRDS